MYGVVSQTQHAAYCCASYLRYTSLLDRRCHPAPSAVQSLECSVRTGGHLHPAQVSTEVRGDRTLCLYVYAAELDTLLLQWFHVQHTRQLQTTISVYASRHRSRSRR